MEFLSTGKKLFRAHLSPASLGLSSEEDLANDNSLIRWIRELFDFILTNYFQFSSVYSVMSNSLQPHDCTMPDFPVHQQLPSLFKLMSTELVMPSNHLILCHPLLFPPSIIPSIRGFSSESVLHIRWPILEFHQPQSFQWIFRIDFL